MLDDVEAHRGGEDAVAIRQRRPVEVGADRGDPLLPRRQAPGGVPVDAGDHARPAAHVQRQRPVPAPDVEHGPAGRQQGRAREEPVGPRDRVAGRLIAGAHASNHLWNV